MDSKAFWFPAPPGNPYVSGAARKIYSIHRDSGRRASSSCIPKQSLGTREQSGFDARSYTESRANT